MKREDKRRIVDRVVELEDRDAVIDRLTALLPEARVIKQIIDDDTSRVITFELLTSEE
ncbi:MAG TPA: hypothetical protein VGL86_19940 [Polyangia bacterium]|jgi:hypothetical protein